MNNVGSDYVELLKQQNPQIDFLIQLSIFYETMVLFKKKDTQANLELKHVTSWLMRYTDVLVYTLYTFIFQGKEATVKDNIKLTLKQ